MATVIPKYDSCIPGWRSAPSHRGDAAPAPAGHLGAVLYLMCDDLAEEIRTLEAKGVRCAEVTEERWGRRTAIRLPSGGEVGLYQPSHPTALGLAR